MDFPSIVNSYIETRGGGYDAHSDNYEVEIFTADDNDIDGGGWGIFEFMNPNKLTITNGPDKMDLQESKPTEEDNKGYYIKDVNSFNSQDEKDTYLKELNKKLIDAGLNPTTISESGQVHDIIEMNDDDTDLNEFNKILLEAGYNSTTRRNTDIIRSEEDNNSELVEGTIEPQITDDTTESDSSNNQLANFQIHSKEVDDSDLILSEPNQLSFSSDVITQSNSPTIRDTFPATKIDNKTILNIKQSTDDKLKNIKELVTSTDKNIKDNIEDFKNIIIKHNNDTKKFEDIIISNSTKIGDIVIGKGSFYYDNSMLANTIRNL
jgi:hypothetical protein